jgi:hypothetical protein
MLEGGHIAMSKFERLMWAEDGFSSFQWYCLMASLLLGMLCGGWIFGI